MKTCVACKEAKSFDHFSKSSKGDGYQSRCKPCFKQYHHNWYLKNKDSEAGKKRAWAQLNRQICTQRVKNWQKKNPNSVKNYALKTEYGITLEFYNALLAKQGNKCAICSKTQVELKRKLAVDHCHETGKIRGLLCDTCNRGIGYLKDSISVLETAIAYLRGNNG